MQGVLPREDMQESMIAKLEGDYTEATGEVDRLEYITWFTIDRSDAIAHFEGGRAFKVGRKTVSGEG